MRAATYKYVPNEFSETIIEEFWEGNNTNLQYTTDATVTQLERGSIREKQAAVLTKENTQAVTRGDLIALEKILQDRPEAAAFRNLDENTMLTLAAKSHHYEIMQLLLR